MLFPKMIAENRPHVLNSLYQGAAVVLELVKRRKARSPEPVTVRVTGPSCSGKTKLVKELLLPRTSTMVYYTIDHDYRGLRFLNACDKQGLSITWDDPEALDLARTARHLNLLRHRQPVPGRMVFNFDTNEPDQYAGPIQPKDSIVCEGLYALFDCLDGPNDITVLVRTSIFGQIIRRLLRDQERSHKAPEQILHDLVYAVIPKYEKSVQPTLHKARVVIDNEYNPRKEAERFMCFEIPLSFSEFLRRTADKAVTGANMIPATDYYLSVNGRNLHQNNESVIIREQRSQFFFIYKGPYVRINNSSGRPMLQVEISRDMSEKLIKLLGEVGRTNSLELVYFLKGKETIVRLNDRDTKQGHYSVYLIWHK